MKSRKWWKAIFYNILEICIINSYIIYKEFLGKKIGYKAFKLIIIEELLDKTIIDKLKEEPSVKKLDLTHFPKNTNLGYYKLCRVCRFENKTKKSAYKCGGCSRKFLKDIILCVDPCFEKFHSDPAKYLKKKKRKNQLERELETQ